MPTINRTFSFILVGIMLIEVAVVLAGAVAKHQGIDLAETLVGLVYKETITPEDLQSRYLNKQLKILLVPGHDPQYPGAVFSGVREADLNLLAASNLATILDRDPNFTVITTRNFSDGNYISELADYFVTQRDAIVAFRENQKREFNKYVESGEVAAVAGVHHNFAQQEVSIRLYGINKWANENDIDVVLHIHFNDYGGRRRGETKYSGFAIYVPEAQYPNARASRALGQAIFNQLSKYFAVSDLPVESAGVVDDQELIAIGSQGTREGASFLIEYGYIYEPQIINPEIRPVILAELAWQTYQGLKRYFEPAYLDTKTLMLPHSFSEHLGEGLKGERDVLALQKVLQEQGLYPPVSRTLNDCPMNGNFGPCTAEAVKLFQTKYELPATGYVGNLTLQKLNELYAG